MINFPSGQLSTNPIQAQSSQKRKLAGAANSHFRIVIPKENRNSSDLKIWTSLKEASSGIKDKGTVMQSEEEKDTYDTIDKATAKLHETASIPFAGRSLTPIITIPHAVDGE